MSTNNAVNTTLSGQTGTGTFVGATSPTLVTPTLGVASATSINFGGSALSTYANLTSWTPVFTFATPGDLSVAYTTQLGKYSTIGNLVWIWFAILFTPTYTTSSGDVRITGLPFTGNVFMNGYGNGYLNSPNFPAGRTTFALEVVGNTSYVVLVASGSGVTKTNFVTTQFPTGVQQTIEGSVIYSV